MTIVILLFLSYARTEEIDFLREKLILAAKSKQDLGEKLKSASLIKELRFKCDFELKFKKVPSSCQKHLKFLENLKLITTKELNQRIRALDDICVETVQDLSAKQVEPASFGGKCQQAIDLKLKEKNYIVKEAAPQNIIFSKSNQ